MSTAPSVGFPSRIGIDVFTDQKGLRMKNPPLPNTHSRRVCDTEVFEKYSQGMTTFNQN